MKKIYMIMIAAVSAGVFAGCESLEDTYDEYAGDGRVRNTGVCRDLKVSLGWESVTLSWKNVLDPNRVNILVEWAAEETAGDTLLQKDAESCTIPHLTDMSYTLNVYAVDKDGRRSQPLQGFGRPYSMTHESLKVFTPVVHKCFPLGENRLALFFDRWDPLLINAVLTYSRKSNGKPVRLELTGADSILTQKMYVLHDIDLHKPLAIERVGSLSLLPGKEITFDPLPLDVYKRSFNADLIRELQTRYFVKTPDESFVNSVTELELDYDLASLEDLLYFPNLKKISLGKNRYLYEAYKEMTAPSTLADTVSSRLALQLLHEVKGVVVERYNKHYFSQSFPWMTEKGNPCVPALHRLAVKSIMVSPLDQSAGPENLLDDDLSTDWFPREMEASRRHELLIDLGQVETVAGFKVAQSVADPVGDAQNVKHKYRPSLMKVMVSVNKAEWKAATFDEDNVVGNTAGEITLLRIKQPVQARYVKVIVADLSNGKKYGVVLSEFVPFGE